jgi:hypothetical protein
MTHTNTLISLALALAAAVASMGIGAFLLRNAVKDTLDLASMLPTYPLKEDTSEVRQANRRRVLSETLRILTFRSTPGSILVICGAGLLVWICLKFLPLLRT